MDSKYSVFGGVRVVDILRNFGKLEGGWKEYFSSYLVDKSTIYFTVCDTPKKLMLSNKNPSRNEGTQPVHRVHINTPKSKGRE